MLEPVTLAAVSVLLSGRWAGRKLLGPVCDEIGKDLAQGYSDRRLRNIDRIGRTAREKLGPAIDTDGEVAPRVARKVLEEGSWCDAPVMAEYFGGILAASRQPHDPDDRGASWAGLVARLASADVYVHYLVYEAFRRTWLGEDLEVGSRKVLAQQMGMYIPESAILTTMAPDDADIDVRDEVVLPSMLALIREGLLAEQPFVAGGPEDLERSEIDAPEDGFLVWPSHAGFELYLWAHGQRVSPTRFLDTKLRLHAVEDLKTLAEVQPLP